MIKGEIAYLFKLGIYDKLGQILTVFICAIRYRANGLTVYQGGNDQVRNGLAAA